MKINHKKLTKNIFLFMMVLALPYVSIAETKNKKNEIKNKNFELGAKSIPNQFLIRLKSHVNIDEINTLLS